MLDGVADEKAWARAGDIKGFTTFAPNTGVPARHAVSGKVLHTETALHFFFDIQLKQAPREFLIPRDSEQIGDMDRISIHLDPGGNARLQALPSEHATVLETTKQPEFGSQRSRVQTSPSSQSKSEVSAPRQSPNVQVSSVVHSLPSSHETLEMVVC